MDGKARASQRAGPLPDVQTNVVPIQESMGAYNAMQQSDVHAYWEFNYTGTNWIHPLYELPFTGGLPGSFARGDIGKLLSIVPDPARRACELAGRLRRQPELSSGSRPIRGNRRSMSEFRERGQSRAGSPTDAISTRMCLNLFV